MHTQNQAGADNLQRLLDSRQADNVTLAVELMVTSGVPQTLMSQVLAIGLLHKNKETRLKAMEALAADPGSPIQHILRANPGNIMLMAFDKLMDRIGDIAADAHIDGHKFTQMAAWLNALFEPQRLQYMTTEELEDEVVVDHGLHYMNKYFKALPAGIHGLERLDHLQLCMLKLKSVPEGLDRIKGLKGLDLNHNLLQDLPDWFANLERLELLRLAVNKFKEIPAVLQRLPRLRELDFARNQLKELPGALTEYPALRDLDLSDCGFSTLPDVLAKIPRLEGLRLSGQGIDWKVIPDAIADLRHLKRLTLSSHQFKSLPDALIDLPLEELDFSFGKLAEIPNWLPFITTLRSLNFFYCQDLWRLPQDIGDLVNLEELNLSGTNVTELPPSFAMLHNLKKLYLPAASFAHPDIALATMVQLKGLEEVNDLAYPERAFLRKLHKAMPNVRFGG